MNVNQKLFLNFIFMNLVIYMIYYMRKDLKNKENDKKTLTEYLFYGK